ncbi:hypothetical protein [uncultured Sphingomonas sp.]|nr:hypothetical protein [uncultured Sphingomonas sp.]
MRDYLITIITATAAAWLLQHTAPPSPVVAARATAPTGAATH